ncbi:MAG TPA: LysR family transcriptional regulator [Vineibacter sp.]|nr:LysR family transcriptional regulator [Vineibacter sp.]
MLALDRATLRQLRIFDAAARHLHFGRAAAEIGVTQPAVSIQLRQLEQTVGAPLFEQMGRRKYLTHVGAELARHARAVLGQLRLADEALQRLGSPEAGMLEVVSTTTAEYFVPRLLAEFRKNRPGLSVRLTIKNRDGATRDLADNAVDLAVMGRGPAGLDTTAAPFAQHPLAIVAPPDHVLASRKRLRLSHLSDETFLVREYGSGTRDAMERAFGLQAFQPREAIEIGPNEAIKQAVMAGMGLGFVSLHTVAVELAARRLVVLAVAGMPVVRQWHVIHRRTKHLAPAATAFKAYLVERGAARLKSMFA